MNKQFNHQLGGGSKEMALYGEPVYLHLRKEKSITAGLLFLFVMLFVLPVQAQSNLPVATINKSGQIILDTSAPISASYQADISSLEFANEKVATAFFERLTDGITSFTLDFQNNKVTINLATRMLADANEHWDVNQWNNYFSKKPERLKQAGAQ